MVRHHQSGPDPPALGAGIEADGFLLFPHVKEALDRHSANANSLNTAAGVTATISEESFAAA